MYFFIPLGLIAVLALAVIGGGYNLISHRWDIIYSLGIGLKVFIGLGVAFIILFSIFYFITRKHCVISIILTFITIGILLCIAWKKTVIDEYAKHDTYNTVRLDDNSRHQFYAHSLKPSLYVRDSDFKYADVYKKGKNK